MPLLPKPPECYDCPLYEKDPQGFSRPEGKGTLGVLAFGEALGDHERADGLPFRPFAEAGSLLERTFKRLGWDREQFALWNIVACRPPKNWLEGAPWEVQAIHQCKVHRDRVVEQYRPRCLLALGGVALRTLTGMAGWRQGVTNLRGYVLPAMDYPDPVGKPLPVIGTYHPSYIRRGNAKLTQVLMNDVQLAVKIAREGWDWEATDPDSYPGERVGFQPMTEQEDEEIPF